MIISKGCVFMCVCIQIYIQSHMQYFLNRFPLNVSLFDLELYLTHINCYQNRLKWYISRWQNMVEVITLQRPLSNQPPELSQRIIEIARHLCKSEPCIEGTQNDVSLVTSSFVHIDTYISTWITGPKWKQTLLVA